MNCCTTTTKSQYEASVFFYGLRLAFASDKRDFVISVMPSGELLLIVRFIPQRQFCSPKMAH